MVLLVDSVYLIPNIYPWRGLGTAGGVPGVWLPSAVRQVGLNEAVAGDA